MGFTTSNLSLYHTFSKTPVDSNTSSAAAQLGNAINKSGHTVQSNEIWTESIPFFGLAATTTAIHTKFSSTAKVNDLVKDSDGKIWQRNSTAYSPSATFDNLWSEKTKSITSFTKGADGKYTFTEAEGALVDGSYLLNSEGVPTVKYYEKRLLTRLTADNNANTNSDNKASRLQIDGKWIDQFIGVTDIYLNGSAAVSYAPVLRKTSSSSPMQAGPGKGYMDYCATGLILWESSAAGTEVIDCFEYVGAKLNSTVAKLTAAVFGSNNGGSDQPVDLVTQVNQNTAAINLLNSAATEPGSVAQKIETAINGLGDVAVKSDITITDIKVKQGSGEATSLTITDKSVTIEIPEVPAADVTEDGVVTTDGFTKTADVTNLANAAIDAAITSTDGAIADAIDSAISDATLTSGDNAIESATGDTATKLVTAEQVKEYVDENAKVTLTADTTTGKTGITISPNAQESTSFTIGIDQTIIATKQSVDDLSATVSGVSHTITDIQTSLSTGSIATAIQAAQDAADAAQDTADEAKGIAETAVQSVIVNDTEAKSGTAVSITALTAVDGNSTGSNGITIGETDKKVTLSVTPATYTSTSKTWGNDTNFAKASDIATAISDAVDAITIPDVTTSIAAQTVGVTASGHEVSVATATYTPAVGETAASWTNQGYLVTGSTVETFVGAETTKTLEAAKAYSDSLHTTSLDYVVLGDSESLPTASADTLGKIYLVATAKVPTEDGSALSGDYVEYMTRKVGDGETATYTWEKIGTTEADLSAYAKTADLNVTETTVNGLTYSQTDGVVSASVAKASTTQVGTVQLTNTYTSTDDTNAATGKSIAAAIDTLDSTKSVNGITVTQENGVISNVTEELITASVPEGTTSVDGNVAYVGTEKHVIAPEKFQTAAQMPATLTSWVADLSNLTVGDNMFKGCTGLTTFVGDLSSLTSGVDMFNGCALDDESLEILAENLPTVSGSPIIDLGTLGGANPAHLNPAATIRSKGWVVYSNGTEFGFGAD